MPQPVPVPDRFKPEMPAIPGVCGAPARSAISGKKTAPLILLVLVLAGIGWRILSTSRGKAKMAAAASVEPPAAFAEVPELVKPPAASSETVAATVEELAAPWSAAKFTFVDPKTHASLPAMIVRLPKGSAAEGSSYWAFLLEAPLANCDLDYVTSLAQLASTYAYRATHPMVVAACDGTLYDPLKFETAPGGAWVRGAIVQGAGIRPPLAVEVRVKGGKIVADRSE